uniref:Uncharacterized protein n=1 Tax=Fagus sylvatica TaxID=28930 RepID=A0A2N9IV65_FAGSY
MISFPPQSSRRLSLSHFASRSLTLTLTFSPPASHRLISRSHLRYLGLDLSLSRFLTSRSHFRRDLTSMTHGLDFHRLTLVACDLTAALGSCSRSRRCSRSHRRLTLAISPPPLVLDSLTH